MREPKIKIKDIIKEIWLNSWITIHLEIKPRKGGTPPKERKRRIKTIGIKSDTEEVEFREEMEDKLKTNI